VGAPRVFGLHSETLAMRRSLLAAGWLFLAGCGPGLLGGGKGSDSGTPPGGDGGNPGNDAGGSWDAGSPGSIDTASQKYPDAVTLWTRSIERTCGPNGGVCHNSRQSPDMQTSANFLGIINARCNLIRDQPSQIDNLCEPLGDELHIGSFVTHVGNVQPTPATGTPTTLAITLKDAIPSGTTGAMSLVRVVPGLPSVSIPVPSAAVQTAAAGAQQVTLIYAPLATATAPGGTLATFLFPVAYLPGDDAQVEMGDPNGDGVFGADLDGALVKPGQPLKSYLFLRVLGPLQMGPGQTNTNVGITPQTEAQMPIANFQYWDVGNDTIALWCWISGLAADGSNASAPIDYAHCDISGMPAVTVQSGEATTYSQIWSTVLQPQCSSCHHTGTYQPTTFYMDDPLSTYDLLVGIAGSGPSENALGLPYITKSDPTHSYLYLKVTGDPSITGAQMPLGGALPTSAIDSLNTWITQGANNN
jgi:hypothetical protein